MNLKKAGHEFRRRKVQEEIELDRMIGQEQEEMLAILRAVKETFADLQVSKLEQISEILFERLFRV